MRHTDPRLTVNIYTDEKLLPLAAELQNVPDIPMQPVPVKNAAPADASVRFLLANLTEDQKQFLLHASSPVSGAGAQEPRQTGVRTTDKEAGVVLWPNENNRSPRSTARSQATAKPGPSILSCTFGAFPMLTHGA